MCMCVCNVYVCVFVIVSVDPIAEWSGYEIAEKGVKKNRNWKWIEGLGGLYLI